VTRWQLDTWQFFFKFKKIQKKIKIKKKIQKIQKIEELTRDIPSNVVTVSLTKKTTLRSNLQNRDQIEMKKKIDGPNW